MRGQNAILDKKPRKLQCGYDNFVIYTDYEPRTRYMYKAPNIETLLQCRAPIDNWIIILPGTRRPVSILNGSAFLGWGTICNYLLAKEFSPSEAQHAAKMAAMYDNHDIVKQIRHALRLTWRRKCAEEDEVEDAFIDCVDLLYN